MIKFISLIVFAGMIVMNYLANALPIGGKTTGQISAEYPNLFVPAGITFSIWGIIYLLLAVYCAIQFFPERMKEIPSTVSWLFALSCIFNGLWILAWHYQKLPLSLLIMIGLLFTLILMNIYIKHISYGFVKAALGIYLGWICIATIANLTAFLTDINWKGFGVSGEIWAVVMIAAGTLIVSLSLVRLNNPFIGLAGIWAFVGIIIRHSADNRLITVIALSGCLVTGVIMVLGFFNPHLVLKGD